MGEYEGGNGTASQQEKKQAYASAATLQPPRYLWWTGQLVPWAEATVHVTMVGWPAVGAVFEGIRAYWNAEQERLYVFRLQEHMRRFAQSMKLMRMIPEIAMDEVGAAVCEVLRANELRQDAYIQPLAYSSGRKGWGPWATEMEAPEIVITSRPSASALMTGRTLTAGITSWTRISDNVLPPRVKALPNYANSRLASAEARRNGYDEPIFLNPAGKVSEGPGSCLFMVRDGVAITPPTTAGTLESITRDACTRLLEDMGVRVEMRELERTELYVADEVFFSGTAIEVAPVSRVDGFDLPDGGRGPIVTRLEEAFDSAVRSNSSRYAHWLTEV